METAVQTPPAIAKSENTAASDIQRIYEAQLANKQNIKNTTASQRRRKLKALRATVIEMRHEITQAIWEDFKKPTSEADLVEIYPTISELKHTIKHVGEWMKPRWVDTPLSYFGSTAKVVYEPKGTALIISPWNYPFQLCLIPVATAVASGNTAIIKPSEFTPNTSKIIKKVLGKVFQENEMAVVEGDHTVSQELLKLKFDHIFFTGSPQVGKIIMRAAADNLTTVTLELGGKSPAIVDNTANIKTAAKRITWGKYLNAGQTCIAPDYILVHESKHDELVAEVKKSIQASYGETEEGRQQSEDLARIVNSRHHLRIKKLINDAVEKGANIEIGGAVNDGENYIAPTVLTNVSLDSEIMHEEIFGPVMPIIKFSNLDEAIELINTKEKPLAFYIFSGKNANINKLMDNSSAGGTCINDTLIHNSHPNLPFGGVNNSGIGKGHGEWGFREFSNERAVVRQLNPAPPAQNMYPPYKGFAKKMIELTLKYF